MSAQLRVHQGADRLAKVRRDCSVVIKEPESLHRRTRRPAAKRLSRRLRSGIVACRRMNDQLERAAIAESNGCEVTHVACCQTTIVERLGEGYDRTVDETEVKASEASIHIRCTREMTDSRRRVGECVSSQILPRKSALEKEEAQWQRAASIVERFLKISENSS